MLKTCQIAVSKPNRNSLWGFGSAREQFEARAAKGSRKLLETVLRVPKQAAKGSRKLLGRF